MPPFRALLLLLSAACGTGLSVQRAGASAPPSALAARSLHVDPAKGDDAHDGQVQPVRTIARALKLAQPGDSIHLAPATYYESADFTGKHGEPGRPITLDGHGAILEGSDPVRLAEWEALGDGLYRKVKLMPRMDDAILMRWFFLWNNKMNRMSRCSKGPSAPLKKPADLAPEEWTYAKEEDAFYVKLPSGSPPAAVDIRYPVRSSGVVFSHQGSHLLVRNITATHVYNDGFNIHGAQRGLVFENIAAIECGDDGFSAHEDADCRIDGFVSIRNSTGLCDTGTSHTFYKNVYMKDCVGFDLYFIGAEHSLENALIESSAARTFHLDGGRLQGGQTCTLRMRNVSIQRIGDSPNELRVGHAGALDADRCTISNLNIQVTPGGSVSLRHSVVTGTPKPEIILWTNSLWRSEENVYDVTSLRVGQQSFPAEKFEEFRRLMGGEKGSRAGAAPDAAATHGADVASLQLLRPKAASPRPPQASP